MKNMVRDDSLIKLNKRVTEIFEDIKDICESFIGDYILTDTNPDAFITKIKNKISEYDKIFSLKTRKNWTYKCLGCGYWGNYGSQEVAEEKGMEHIKKCKIPQLKSVLIEYELHVGENPLEIFEKNI